MNNDYNTNTNNGESKKDDRGRRGPYSFDDYANFVPGSIYYDQPIPFQTPMNIQRTAIKQINENLDYSKVDFHQKPQPDFDYQDSFFESHESNMLIDQPPFQMNDLKYIQTNEPARDRTIPIKGKHVMFNPQVLMNMTSKEDAIYRERAAVVNPVNMEVVNYPNEIINPQVSQQQQQVERKNKSNVKNTYIKKINSLINIPKTPEEANSQQNTIKPTNIQSQEVIEPGRDFDLNDSYYDPVYNFYPAEQEKGKYNLIDGSKEAPLTKEEPNIYSSNKNGNTNNQKSPKGSVENQPGNQSVSNEKKVKHNVKNTYIKKINSLINIAKPGEDVDVNSNEQQVEENREEGGKNFNRIKSIENIPQQDDHDDNQKKLERNRESARNSRQRKKIYIELLETKVNQLNSDIEVAKDLLRQNSENLNQLSLDSKNINGLLITKQQLFEMLEKCFREEKPNETQIKLLIDSFRVNKYALEASLLNLKNLRGCQLRLGASGRERFKTLEFFFDKIYEHFLPISLKFLLLSSTREDNFRKEENDFLDQLQGYNELFPNFFHSQLDQNNQSRAQNQSKNSLFSSIVSDLNLSEEQSYNLQNFLKKVAVKKKKFDGILDELHSTQKGLYKQSASLENVIDEISEYLSPTQIGSFLMKMEREKTKKEIKGEKLWFSQQDEQTLPGDVSYSEIQKMQILENLKRENADPYQNYSTTNNPGQASNPKPQNLKRNSSYSMESREPTQKIEQTLANDPIVYKDMKRKKMHTNH